MSFKKILKPFLIMLSVLVFCPAFVQADGPVKVEPNMRAAAGLHQKLDGSFCAIDIRGKSALTPSFVKPSLSAKSSMPKGVPVCSAKETKAFQKKIKTAYLQTQDGAHMQKTMGGAVLGSVIKGLGMGCIVVSGMHLFMRFFAFLDNGDPVNNRMSIAQQTEAKGTCFACQFFVGLSTFGGGSVGAVTALARREIEAKQSLNNIVAELRTQAVPIKKVQIEAKLTNLSPEELQKKIQKAHGEIDSMKLQRTKIQKHAILIGEKIDQYKAQGYLKPKTLELASNNTLGLKAQTIHLDVKEFFKLDKKMTSLRGRIDNKIYKVDLWHKALRNPQSLAFKQAVESEAKRRVRSFTHQQLIQTVPEAKTQAIIQKHSKALHKIPGVTGLLSGAAGAVICNEGAAYLLTPEDTQI